MTDPQWTEPQRKLMEVIYGKYGLWDPPCQHPGPVWVVDPDGTGRCTMCPARWTIVDENERAARIAAGPPEGESDRDRMWREFREATWRSRPLILPLPPDRGETASYPAGTTVWHCPLPTCEWTFAQAPPDPNAPAPAVAGATLDESISLSAFTIVREWYAAAEVVLEAHLATHTTLEWVTEINRLTTIMAKVTNELADTGRIGSSLLTGALATRANLAREEAMDWLREGIASKREAPPQAHWLRERGTAGQ